MRLSQLILLALLLAAFTTLPTFAGTVVHTNLQYVERNALNPDIGRGQSGRLFSALLTRNGTGTLEYALLPNARHDSGDLANPKQWIGLCPFLQRPLEIDRIIKK